MKIAKYVVGSLLGLVVLLLVLETIAAESGEVVVLSQVGVDGQTQQTRLWVVDLDGHSWVRAGISTADWAARIGSEGLVSVARQGQSQAYRAVAVPAMTPHINQLMRGKYGWRDQFISALTGGRERSVALRLDPLEGPAL